jgi:hypothetical protein
LEAAFEASLITGRIYLNVLGVSKNRHDVLQPTRFQEDDVSAADLGGWHQHADTWRHLAVHRIPQDGRQGRGAPDNADATSRGSDSQYYGVALKPTVVATSPQSGTTAPLNAAVSMRTNKRIMPLAAVEYTLLPQTSPGNPYVPFPSSTASLSADGQTLAKFVRYEFSPPPG